MDHELHQALLRLEAKVDGVDDKLDGFAREWGPKMATLDLRVTQLEAHRERSDEQQTKLRDRRWLLYLAVLAAFVALAGSFVAPVLVR